MTSISLLNPLSVREDFAQYRHLLDDRMSIIDIGVLLHQTPGGMLSNLINQLREMGASDRLDDDLFRALPEVAKTWARFLW